MVDKIAHALNEPTIANLNDLYASKANNIRKIRFIPISAGTITTDLVANSIEFVRAIKRKAITIVDGKVPRIPPTFVPYLSAIIVIKTTTNADNMNGTIV